MNSNTLRQQGYWLETGVNNPLHKRLQRHRAQAYERFRRSWQQLILDPYLRDGGKYRYRRYNVLHWQQRRLTVLPYEPHYQTRHHNTVHGGFFRQLRAWLPTTLNNPVLYDIIHWTTQQFTEKSTSWRIQAHQFRITANTTQHGKPTPEGIHQDGADYILILLLDRQHISGGVSRIYDYNRTLLTQTTLQNTGNFILLNDHTVFHDVSTIIPATPPKPGWRDVLVLTFHKSTKTINAKLR